MRSGAPGRSVEGFKPFMPSQEQESAGGIDMYRLMGKLMGRR
jgi:hypothetical protein